MATAIRTGVGLGVGACAYGGYVYWNRSRLPVVVVGGGVIGLTTAESVAKAGRRVVLIDANHPIRGSWGVTRASHFRMEDRTLLKMSLFSQDRWRNWQETYVAHGAASGVAAENTLMYQRVGAVMVGPRKVIENLSNVVGDELRGKPQAEHEILTAVESAARWPQFRVDDAERVFYTEHGYTMLVQTCLECLAWIVGNAGVQYHEDAVTSIDRGRKLVETESGLQVKYSDIVIAAGPWTNKVLSSAGLSGMPLVVSNEQTVEMVEKPGAPSHDWNNFPLFTWSEAGYKGVGAHGGCKYFYTVPHVPLSSGGSAGVKIGYHRQGPLLDNDDFQVTELGKACTSKLPHQRKEFQRQQEDHVDEFAWKNCQEFVRAKMPGLDDTKYESYMRCLYQMTPDMKMIVGRHPEDSGILLACGFSGSGFQFAPAVADMLTTLLIGSKRNAMHDSMAIDFDPKRFWREDALSQ